MQTEETYWPAEGEEHEAKAVFVPCTVELPWMQTEETYWPAEGEEHEAKAVFVPCTVELPWMQTEETYWPAEGVEQVLIVNAPVVDADPTDR